MKILDRFLGVFGKRHTGMLGALYEQNDLKGYIYAIRARTYLKLTGKAFPVPSLPTQNTSPDDTMRNLSPSRRLARKGL
ncbi:hypothetical protein EU527_04985 [Candidatus Thorarchaeota archaeon]|nr:MAG: hypothetical protein EU527_04985 [Candidatus Thorarchaeota archaeon]